MAEYTLSFIIEAENKAKATIDSVKSQLEGIEGKLKSMQPAFKKMALVGTAAFAAISGAVGGSIKEAAEAESQFVRMEHILKTASKASDSQVTALKKQAEALERVGVVSKGTTLIAQGQLGTFNLQADSIERLIPSILNYAVAEKGASVSAEEMRQMTNGLAQALNGNFASLTRVGFVLDDNTRAMIENGTETERINALVQVLDSTYAGFNERARNTAEGGMIALKNSFNQIKESIGNALLPVLNNLMATITPIMDKIAQWIEQHPDLAAKIGMAALAITGIIAVIGTLGMILPGIIAGFSALIGVVGFLLSPIGLAVAAIGILVAVGIYAWKYWDEIKEGFVFIWQSIKDGFFQKIDAISNKITGWVDSAKSTIITGWTAVKTFFKNLWDSIVGIFASAWERITAWANKIADVAKGVWNKAKEVGSAVGEKVTGAWETVKGWFGSGGTIPRTGTYMLHRGEQIVSANNSGSGIIVNINGGTYLDRDVAEEIGDMIVDKLKAIQRL